MRIVGIVLVVLGIIGLTYGGITWTHREKVLDLGSVEVTHDKHERVPVPPIAGAVSIIVGTTILVSGRRGAA